MYQRSALLGAQKAARNAAPKKSWMASVIGTRYTIRICKGLMTRVNASVTSSSGRSKTRGRTPEPSFGKPNGSPAGSRTKSPALRCMRQMLRATTPRYQESTWAAPRGGSAASRWEARDVAMYPPPETAATYSTSFRRPAWARRQSTPDWKAAARMPPPESATEKARRWTPPRPSRCRCSWARSSCSMRSKFRSSSSELSPSCAPGP
mmetsp:Transcript_42573/g.131792  ORF Transcript_42573/g.131792 Transcript_42573/m.131792 type:complete len:207 (-) Transcript_42573:20-640(-)